MRSVLLSLLFASITGYLFGCAAVAPLERAALAKKKMQMDPDAEAAAFEQHVYEYREGASGGYGAVGGGCGCN